MAGDWIKMRSDLADDPAVIEMAAVLGVDEFAVTGRLHKLWSWADKHCADGHAKSVTFVWIDRYISHAGFAATMQSAGWLAQTDNGICFPRFDRHNGENAKKRVEATERKRLERELAAAALSVAPGSGQMSQKARDKSVTREEKRREDSKPPLSPKGEKRAAICLRTFLDACTEKQERPVRDYQPLWLYVESVGLDTDMVALAWAEFCRQMLPGGVNASKRQADWRKTFRNYVEKNYLKLWAIDPEGKFFLTTAGKTAQKMQDSKEPA